MSGDLGHVALERSDDIVVARIDGEIDLSNAAEVGRAIRLTVGTDATALVVDLTSTQYLDSSAVQELFELADELAIRRQGMHVVVPEGAVVRNLVDLVGLPEAARRHSTLEEALASARAR